MSLINVLQSKTKEEVYSVDKENNQYTEVREVFSKLVGEKKLELLSKILSGNTEQSFQTGADSYTETEWKKLLMEVDAAQNSSHDSDRANETNTENTIDLYYAKHPDEIGKKNHFYEDKWYSFAELTLLCKKESEVLFSDDGIKNECIFNTVDFDKK